MTALNIQEFLAKVDLFEQIQPPVLGQIAQIYEGITLPAGQTLFQQGARGDALYLIAKGQVEVFVRDSDTGAEIALRSFGVFEYIGEMSLLTDEPRSASARAVVDSLVLRISGSHFRQLVARLPEVGMALARVLARRVGELNAKRSAGMIELAPYKFSAEAFACIPHAILEMHKALPLRRHEDFLSVGMVNPGDLVALDDLRRASGLLIEPLAISIRDYEDFRHRHAHTIRGPLPKHSRERPAQGIRYHGESDAKDPRKASPPGAAVIDALDQILAEALDRGASDIHMEPTDTRFEVRYRVDGRLVDRSVEERVEFAQSVISRIKVMARMDVSEQRMPQDGRFGISHGRKDVELRVSTIPTMYGEKAVLRILDAAMLDTGLDNLILAARVRDLVRDLSRQPYGMVVVSGPTGSGKTTTLYSLLHEMDREARSVVTVEDPIEYSLERITQTQVEPKRGLEFSSMIRALLRQNPDVIMVGEIRDGASAKACAEAAMTGHLVLTSLHANDATASILRLRELGVESSVLANAMIGVVNQRLLRRICSHCRGEASLDQRQKAKLAQTLGAEVAVETLFEGRGCPECRGSGFAGRISMLEVLKISTALRQAIFQDISPGDLRQAATQSGLIPMRAYAGFLLQRGLTTLDEACAVLTRET